MKYITNIIKNIFSKEFPKELPKPMGRWRTEYNNKRMNNKIDLSNEDHCGPCGQYALTKIEKKNQNQNKEGIPLKKENDTKNY